MTTPQTVGVIAVVVLWDRSPLVRARGGLRVAAWVSLIGSVVASTVYTWTFVQMRRGATSQFRFDVAGLVVWCFVFASFVVQARFRRSRYSYVAVLMVALLLLISAAPLVRHVAGH